MKKHGPKSYGSTTREPLIDLQEVRRWLASFRVEGHNAEAVLNIVVTVGVIAFVAYQFLSLLHRINKRVERQLENMAKKKTVETQDRGCGDDSVFTDLHEQVLREKHIPFRLPYLDDETTLKNSQLFYEEMKMRRSVRAFSSRAVPMKVIQNLIKTAGTAPSVGNLQPWRFCVILNDGLKLMIREVLEAAERDNYVARKKGAAWVVDVSQLQDTWRRPYITDAPSLLVVCHEVFAEMNEKKERLYGYNHDSTAISVGILLAAIQNVGLSTVVTSPLNVGPDISRLLRRPESESVLLLLPLGYAAEDVTVPDLKRKPVEFITKLY
ncbi:unnamed protein product [Caenorhabditis auriculariae]|uniref:Nitroreductase domain-containing protein n=1 Tax=Caenorhabditis auriculariae TaxID=2777116 RepID=A0A8S1HBQ6_9PELO|nr:unnamed protein product [Caenorhabditis auriculariae]